MVVPMAATGAAAVQDALEGVIEAFMPLLMHFCRQTRAANLRVVS